MTDSSRDDLPVLRDDRLPILTGIGPEHDPVAADMYPEWSSIASQRHARCLAVSSGGAIWLATAGGILRWSAGLDRFTRYGSEHGLPGSSMAAVAVDRSDLTWAAHESGQLCYLAGNTWHLYEPLRDVTIICLAVDNAGRLWAAGTDGVYAVDSRFTPPSPLAAPAALATVRALAVGDEGEVWLADARGVYRHDGTAWQAPQETVNVLAMARQGDYLWLGTTTGLRLINLTTREAQPTSAWPRGEVTALTGAMDGVWAAIRTVGSGGHVGLATATGWYPIPGPPLGPQVRGLAPGAPSEVWIATAKGLAHGGPDGVQWYQTEIPPDVIRGLNPERPPDTFTNMVQALALQRADNRPVMWIGTAGGLFRLDLSDQTWRAYAHPGLRDVRALAPGAADDELWAASWDGGLHRLKGRVLSYEAPAMPRSIVTLATGTGPDRWAAVALDGASYLGGPPAFGPHPPPLLVDGVYRNNGQEWSLALPASKLRASGLPFRERIQAVAQAEDGCLWIGTSSGLFSYDPQEDLVLAGGGEAGSADVRVVLPLADDLLCVGTGRGLLIGQPGALTHLPDLEGRPVTALAWDEASGVLWVGMDRGLAKLRAHGAGWKARTWTAEASGMASDRVTALAPVSLEPGETQVWIGTPAGLSCYHHRY